jgi:hypothetical protein
MAQRKTLRLPITNVYAKGGFCVTVSIGSENDTANLILDTGSSSFIVTKEAYQTKQDQSFQATSYAQCVKYGIGGWYGPVVKTDVNLHSNNHKMLLKNTHVSITEKMTTQNNIGCFANADGILGLAYHKLNRAYNLNSYFTDNNVNPATTSPWKNSRIKPQSIKAFKQFAKAYPKSDIKPYFTELEEQGISANKFSFMTYRSSIHHKTPHSSLKKLKSDPLNQGLFILGGGEEDKDLYQGEFKRIKVIDDVYYNVRLLKVKIADFETFDVPKLKGKELERHHSNAFMDTGASVMVLDNVLFNYIIDCFEKTHSNFKAILKPFLSFEGVEEGIPLEQLDLNEWPDIEFIFEASVDSKTEEVSLMCKAKDYWQINAPKHGEASFKILSQLPNWPDQSILGLPLISNYYVIFARFENEFGDIKFAEAKPLK